MQVADASFKLETGEAFTIRLDTAEIRRAKQACGVDVLEFATGDLYARMVKDPLGLCDLLYAVCKPQADALKLDDIKFGQGLRGDAIHNGLNALIDGVANFLPSRERGALLAARATATKIADAGANLIQAKIADIESEALSRLTQSMATSGV